MQTLIPGNEQRSRTRMVYGLLPGLPLDTTNPSPPFNPTSCMEASPNQPDEETAPSWESYLLQLGAQFQVNITAPDATLRLSALATESQLIVGVHPGFVVVSYGESSETGIAPNAELVLDIGADGKLLTSEITYRDEVWRDFQRILAESDQPPTNEQSFDGDRFAAYLLNKVTQEQWTAEDRLRGSVKS